MKGRIISKKAALCAVMSAAVIILSAASAALYFNIRSMSLSGFEEKGVLSQNYYKRGLTLPLAATGDGAQALSNSGEVLFVVAEYGGAIGIYDAGRRKLVEVLDVDVAALPENDRLFLEKGIEIRSAEELLSVICDYTS